MIRRKNTMIKPLFISISIVVLMFQSNIASFFSAIKYYDEIVSLVLFFFCFIQKRGKIGKNELRYCLVFFLVFVIGVLGNLRTNINNTAFLILSDELGLIKIFLTMYAIKGILNESECEETVKLVSIFFQGYVFAAALCYLSALIFGWAWMFKQVRFGFRTFGFVHGRSGDGWLGYYLEACYCIFLMRGNRLKFAKTTRIVCLFLTIITLKGPAMLFVALIVLYRVIKTNGIRTYHIILTIVVSLIVGWWGIKKYLLTSGEARGILYTTSFKIARDYFPTGMGFSTFGSDLSRVYYSDAYSIYGINTVYGLGGSNSVAFITDNYWAMILGQFGFISALLFLYIYFHVFSEINSKKHIKKEIKMGILAMFFSFMAGSIGSAYLTSFLGVLCFAVIGIYINPCWSSE